MLRLLAEAQPSFVEDDDDEFTRDAQGNRVEVITDLDEREAKAIALQMKERKWKCRGCQGRPVANCDCVWCTKAKSRCHHCGHYYDVMFPKRSKTSNASKRTTLADALNAKPLEYYSTGVEGLDRVLGGGVVLDRVMLLSGPQGLGKPLACDTPVPTPTGWSTQGELKAGDEVIGVDGKVARVLGNTGPMLGRPCYRMMFSDGTSIVADGEHPWSTRTIAERVACIRLTRLRSTEGIAATLGDRHSIEPAHGPLVFGRIPESARRPRLVTAVEPVDSVPVCCISTDRPDGLYVAGKQWIVTHNTTLLLQAADHFARDGRKAYFASAEMTQEAIIEYARRLGITNPNVNLYANSEGIDVSDLFEDVLRTKSKLLIGDSVQVFSVSDVKGDIGEPTMMNAVINMVSSFCQKKHVASILISHLNKDGDIAGARKMQYLVDGLLRFESKQVFDQDNRVIEGTEFLREITADGKMRQAKTGVSVLVEMDHETGRIVEPSMKARRALSKLQLV